MESHARQTQQTRKHEPGAIRQKPKIAQSQYIQAGAEHEYHYAMNIIIRVNITLLYQEYHYIPST